jgi:hypothetical protein
MNKVDRLYSFVYRGELAQEALDKAGRVTHLHSEFVEAQMASELSVAYLDTVFVERAKEMAAVYTAIAAFENSVRKLVQTILIEAHKETWWESCVSDKIRNKAESRREEEKKIKWHTQRGQDLINYTELGDLASVIRQNWELFEPHLRSAEWAKSIFDVIERSRNVIMHSGSLEREDIQRMGINIRDWIKQVG